MTEAEFFKLIQAKLFFTEHCKDIPNWSHKRRKFDGNKKPIDFSPVEKKRIEEAAKKLGKELGTLKM